MRISAEPDSVVNRLDRALWLSPPFDRSWLIVASSFISLRPRSLDITLPERPTALTLDPRHLTLTVRTRP